MNDKEAPPRKHPNTQDEQFSVLGRRGVVGSDENSQAGEPLLQAIRDAIDEATKDGQVSSSCFLFHL